MGKCLTLDFGSPVLDFRRDPKGVILTFTQLIYR